MYLMHEQAEVSPEQATQSAAGRSPAEIKLKLERATRGAFFNKDGSETDIVLLMDLLKENSNPNDNYFDGTEGTYEINAGYVGGDPFKNGNTTPEAIRGALEMSLVAKASMGVKEEARITCAGGDKEQQAIMEYAGRLVGLNVKSDAGDYELSAETKQKLDAAWEQMKKDKNLLAPAAQPDAQADAQPAATTERTAEPAAAAPAPD